MSKVSPTKRKTNRNKKYGQLCEIKDDGKAARRRFGVQVCGRGKA